MTSEHVFPVTAPAILTRTWDTVLAALAAVEDAVIASEWTLAGQCNLDLHRALEVYDATLLGVRDALDADEVRALLNAFEHLVARHERCTASLHAAHRCLIAAMSAAREGRQGARRYLEVVSP